MRVPDINDAGKLHRWKEWSLAGQPWRAVCNGFHPILVVAAIVLIYPLVAGRLTA